MPQEFERKVATNTYAVTNLWHECGQESHLSPHVSKIEIIVQFTTQ